jgi:hypothetical protein
MRRIIRYRPSPAMAVAFIALLVAIGGVAVASIPGPGGVIKGCYSKSTGSLRVIGSAKSCSRKRERTLSWSQQGPRGLQGVQGLEGSRGLQGAEGLQGAQGNAGPPGNPGAPGAPGAPGVGVNGIFGNGADGDQTLSSNTTLTRDTYYNNLTINAGVILNPGGYRVFVSGTLTLNAGASIRRDSLGGSPLAAGTLGGSAAAGGSTTNSLGGNGGTGGGTASPPAANVGGVQIFDSALAALTGRTLDGVLVTGGAGGDIPNGGGGGGVIVVAARAVSVSSSASIAETGGAGSTGSGGGGGVVVVISTSPQPGGLTLSAAGGSGGAGAGSAGRTFYLS